MGADPRDFDERQREHDKPENMVEPAHLKVKPASTLEEEANSDNSLEGYAAINELNNEPIGKEAEELEEQKEKQDKASRL
jgi:hypothetical protein